MSRTTQLFVVVLVVLGWIPGWASAAIISVNTFTAPSGLDLAGTFVLAEDTFDGSAVAVSGVNFAPESYFVNSPSNGAYFGHNFGASTFSDAGLKDLMDDIRYSPDGTVGSVLQGPMIANLPVFVGANYKLQLLFWEGDSSQYNAGGREDWTILLEGDSITNFNVITTVGGGLHSAHTGIGVVVTYAYQATDTLLNVSLISQGDTLNAARAETLFINGFSLEAIPTVPEPGTAGLLILALGGALAARRARRLAATMHS